MKATWTCHRVTAGERCGTANPRAKKKCVGCGKPRPRKTQPAHRAALETMTYEQAVELWGEQCGICGAGPGTRRLHRDHEHKGSGAMRGLCCFRCNTALRDYMTLDWLRAAVAYLERFEARRADTTGAPEEAPAVPPPGGSRA